MQFDHVAQQVPDIAEAVEWQRRTVPGTTVIHQDPTWALVESGGARFAFVLPDQHPSHVAFRVADAELERLAAALGAAIATHRDATRTLAFSRANSRTTRRPTEPVAASTVTVAPDSGTCFLAASTAAAAVVFAPFESSMTDTRIGPKKHFCTTARSFSPAATSAPPMKTAVFLRSSGPRVNIVP